MMSMDQIRSMSREAGMKAKRSNARPFAPTTEEACRDPRSYGGIKFLGTHHPTGWKKVESLFVDMSGWGEEGEPAWTQDRFVTYMVDHLPDKYGYSVSEQGQFQAYVTVWAPLPGTRRHQRKKKSLLPLKSVNGEFKTGEVPSDDPIAYSYGFMKGLEGTELVENGPLKELATAFKEGWQLGRNVRLGKEPAPAWAKLKESK